MSPLLSFVSFNFYYIHICLSRWDCTFALRDYQAYRSFSISKTTLNVTTWKDDCFASLPSSILLNAESYLATFLRSAMVLWPAEFVFLFSLSRCWGGAATLDWDTPLRWFPQCLFWALCQTMILTWTLRMQQCGNSLDSSATPRLLVCDSQVISFSTVPFSSVVAD